MNQGEARKAVLFTALVGLLTSMPFACSSPAALQGNGGHCLQTTDCLPGLFCVPQKNGAPSMCSTDLSMIVSTEEASIKDGSGEGMMGDGAGQGDGTTQPDTGATKPPGDAAPAPQDDGAPSAEAAPEAGSGGG